MFKGGKPILDNAKGVIIEINDEFKVQSRDADFYLREAVFSLKEKSYASYFDSAGSARSHTYNQIWIK